MARPASAAWARWLHGRGRGRARGSAYRRRAAADDLVADHRAATSLLALDRQRYRPGALGWYFRRARARRLSTGSAAERPLRARSRASADGRRRARDRHTWLAGAGSAAARAGG